MTHGDLAFKLVSRFESNRDDNYHRGTAEHEVVESGLIRPSEEDRENRHKGKEYRTDKGNSVDYFGYIVGSGLTGSVTEDRAAVLFKVVGYFDAVEGNREVEVSERDYKNEGGKYVEGVFRAGRKPFFYTVIPAREDHGEGRGHHNYRVSEDDGHNAAHEDLYRKGGVHTAVHFTADLTFSVLDVKTTFGVVEEYGESNDDEEHKDRDDDPEDLSCVVFDKLDHRGDEVGTSRNDVRKEDHGDTVADTFIVDLFAGPHYEGSARGKTSDDDDCGEPTARDKTGVGVLDREIIAVTGDYRKTDGGVTGYLADFRLAFNAVFRHTLEGGDGDGEKLDNYGSRDIRAYAECEECSL